MIGSISRRTFLALAVAASSSVMLGVRGASAADEDVSAQLDRAFEDGTPFQNEFTSGVLRQNTITELVVTSGRLVACDAFVWGSFELERRVPQGRFLVTLSIAELPNDDRRVAYARVQFRDAKPARWEMAVPVGKRLADLKEDHIYGYPVDSGTGCFMDHDALTRLESMSESAILRFNDALIASFEKHQEGSAEWADMVLIPATGANLVGFTSGWGDGFYASYWGLDADDAPVCLVTDFDVVS